MRTSWILVFTFFLIATASAQQVLFTFNGDSPNDWFGAAVAGAGDVNGDGFADLIVGAPFDDNNGFASGSARVFSGLDGSTLLTLNGDAPSDEFGISVAAVGDVNGDGKADFLVGSLGGGLHGGGSARLFSGLDGTPLFTLNGDAIFDQFGISVASGGDMNGDGIADLIVGADFGGLNGGGYARVFSGLDGTVLYTLHGDAPGIGFGFSVGSRGDVNGDGFADLIVGIPLDDANGLDSGSARVFSGVDGSLLFALPGYSAFDEFGHSVAGAGDVNGDNLADVIVGVWRSDPSGPDSGSARVYSGADGSLLWVVNGDSAGDQLGQSVAGAGDLNGDGFQDLMVGVPGDDSNGSASGSARVLSGLDGSLIFALNGDSANDFLGRSVAGTGDVNGDGTPDLIVGAVGGGVNGGGQARVFSGQRQLALQGPVLAPVGGPITYSLQALNASPATAYLFDLSLTGNTPGIPLPVFSGGPLPLNPPLLNLAFGPLLPGVFVDFAGFLDASGQGTPVFQVPNLSALLGLTFSAAGVTLDLANPSGPGFVSNGVQTLLQ